jgi:SAM-dependent methyltransferase
METPLSIHPYPAKIAPDLVSDVLHAHNPSTVLDPMAGSGVIVRMAADRGYTAVGVDVDPLAVLLSRTFSSPTDVLALQREGERIVEQASSLPYAPYLPWVDGDPETQAFTEYWFGDRQRDDLRRLAFVLSSRPADAISTALKVALSRIIITKSRGASLARDVSHSRPRKWKTESDYNVLPEFLRSVRKLAGVLANSPPLRPAAVIRGDARALPLTDSWADLIFTSPPYGDAIDYLRAHKFALVWLGYSIPSLRRLRRPPVSYAPPLFVVPALPKRAKQYISTLFYLLSESRRVLRPGGHIVLVLADSKVGGVSVPAVETIASVADYLNLSIVAVTRREIPPHRRYLPPPRESSADEGGPKITNRIRYEYVITVKRKGH